MSVKEYITLAFNVLKDFRVLGTVIAMILIIEFAKYVANYKKKPPKKSAKKQKPQKEQKPAPAEKTENADGAEKAEEKK